MLPRLLLIADGFVAGREAMPAEAVRAQTAALVEAGVGAVQLRDHAASSLCFAEAAEALGATLRAIRPDVLLSINTHLDVALGLGAGVHAGWRGPAVEEARRRLGDGGVVGYSAHDPEDARRAVQAGTDYLFASPVFDTPSKPGAPVLGLDGLRRIVAAVPGVPVYALGGITPEHAPRCLAAGAYGVAVLRALLDAPEPAIAVRAFHQALAV